MATVIIQLVLAVMFSMAGIMKLTQPKDRLAENQGWAADFSQPAIRAIGALEVLAALGLAVPQFVGRLRWLVPLAAGGLVLLMLGAARIHFRRKEWPMIGVNILLALLALFVVWGRSGALPN